MMDCQPASRSHSRAIFSRLLSREFFLSASLLATLGLLPACAAEDGSGVYGRRDVELSAFDRVEVSGGDLSVQIRVRADKDPALTVTGDDNLIGRVKAKVKNRVLELEVDGTVWPTLPLQVRVHAPALRGIEASGAPNVSASGIDAERFSLDLSGAADVVLAGTADLLDVDASGASTIQAQYLHTAQTRMDLSGASDSKVCVYSSLQIDASGASDTDWWGTASVSQDLSGASDLRFRGKTCPTYSGGDDASDWPGTPPNDDWPDDDQPSGSDDSPTGSDDKPCVCGASTDQPGSDEPGTDEPATDTPASTDTPDQSDDTPGCGN